jgi:transposase
MEFTKAQMIGMILALLAWIRVLQGQDRDLKARLAQNSRNSSRPPSSDGYEKPVPKSLRQKGQRKTGGQPGHQGVTLEMVKRADHYEMCPLPSHCPCGRSLARAKVENFEKRQVHDLPPPPKLEVTEFQAQTRVCACGRIHTAQFPEHVSQPTQYGPRVQAYVAYYSQRQLVPYERVQETLRDLHAVELSQGTINNILRRGYDSLAIHEMNVVQALRASGPVSFDETGMRVLKELWWLHVASNQTLTFYHIDEHRGVAAMLAMGLLPQFTGTAVHDGWASYFTFGDCEHALCNAHHLRELTFAVEQYEQVWAKKMIECLLEANQEVNAAKKRGKTRLSRSRLTYYCNRYSRILREGRPELPALSDPAGSKKRGPPKQHKIVNLYDRLRQFKYETLAFIHNFSIPFTNNQGERDERMAKIKQKVSGCFRSVQGARMFARVRGYISCALKQGINVLQALIAVFENDQKFIRRLTAVDPRS